MYEIIKNDFYLMLFTTTFMGICFAWGGIYGIFANTKKMDNKVLKRTLRISISVILVCFWLWFFVYKNLYPVSLAKYEYEHNVSVIKTGVIEDVKQHGKDRIYITIDGIEYAIVYGSVDPYSTEISKIIKKGTYVSYSYGENSKFIFDISKATPISNDSG